jgi:hypothetical protein
MSVERILHSEDYNGGTPPNANCFWALVCGVYGWWEDDKTFLPRVAADQV